ncbi:uncharacterized protein LOC141592007 [Silene latifolia]|uniref:uncharacterized protein LOC141592007 n=1 Tax=Silene latifolia TaxID=37657 RepID=UPI003D77DA6C
MVLFIRVLWVPIFTYVLNLFSFIGRHIIRLYFLLFFFFDFIILVLNMSNFQELYVCLFPSRLREKFISEKRNINLQLSEAQKDYQTDENITEDEVEAESLLKFRFRFRTFEEFVEINQLHSVSNSENKDNVYAQRSEGIDEPQLSLGNESSVRDVCGNFSNVYCDDEKITEDGNEPCSKIDVSQKHKGGVVFVERVEENFEDQSGIVGNSLNNVHIFEHGSQLFTDNEDMVSDSVVCSSMSSFRSSFGNSLSDGFLSDIDFERAFEIQTLLEYCFNDLNQISDFSAKEDIEYQHFSKDYGNVDIEDEDEEILEELKDLESDLEDKNDCHVTQAQGEERVKKKTVESNSFADNESLDTNIDLVSEQDKLESNFDDDVNGNIDAESVQNSEKSSSEEQVCSDFESQKELEREWEHQDLVEQLKMEIKKVRAIGLPTIFEESETPKMLEDLKAWKIEEKYEYEGAMDELHKFYKRYRERMRKLDILNYQKMYATGFLKPKEPLKSFNKNKLSNQAIAAIVYVDCWPCKPKSSRDGIEPSTMKKYSKEIKCELEMVYVGQMCLSWEFLCWEYVKAIELWESDPHGLRHYNDVAEKFQTFQILLIRFLEDEPFEGPRLQHYVKNRCAVRDLLQVPLVRDDNYRNRKKEVKVVNEKDAITSLQLVEIIEESIRILWKFIRADRDTSCTVLVNCQPKANVELQNPADTTLLSRLRSTLQKKEKKLKELRSEHCVMKNLHGQQEEGSDPVLYFFSRIDLKLVSRVLNMSRISTDQLVWCSDKLNRIKFVGRKLHVQPSVLLFPC